MNMLLGLHLRGSLKLVVTDRWAGLGAGFDGWHRVQDLSYWMALGARRHGAGVQDIVRGGRTHMRRICTEPQPLTTLLLFCIFIPA